MINLKQKMQIEIDSRSGCCNGVVNALNKAEDYLNRTPKLYSLGSIMHNDIEISRLSQKGLITISEDEFKVLKNSTVLFRAHGEPPYRYRIANENNIKIIDCTCPVVLKLQQKIANKHQDISSKAGKIFIFGKRGHAEVNGLVGQVDGDAIIIENIQELNNALNKKILQSPIAIFSQTTKDLAQYQEVCNYLKQRVSTINNNVDNLEIFDTICRQVSSRFPHLEKFAQKKSLILFVSGKDSSNGKILFELCKKNNPRTYMIESSSDIKHEWLLKEDKIGICGATSTPKWQLEEIKNYIENNYC